MSALDLATNRRLRKKGLTWYVPIGTNRVGMFYKRRLGPDPHANGARTYALRGCPDIFELESGDFAIIGSDITHTADQLPPSAGCGPDERIVRIPRKTLVFAKRDIPDRL